ncbi:MAG: efflux RND transporter permease subunit [Hyphomicrobiales bacterium]|nr:efflux RND transporter permease subunit [Hyphomicrobiales bacterium]
MNLIAIFARHPTASNLLMMLLIIGGLAAMTRLPVQFFPDFGIDVIRVNVEWPGASAEDVDANIIEAIEPEVRFLDGVKRVRSTSQENLGTTSVEFYPGTDMQTALANVETAIGQITTFPEDSEEPEIQRVVRYDSVTRIVLSGPYDERALKAVAKRMRDDLLDRGIDKIDIIGVRDEEIWVDVRPETLLRLDIILADIAEKIAAVSVDLPSGDTGGGMERQIRSLGLRRDATGIGEIEVRSDAEGEKIVLHDIANVYDSFEKGGVTLFNQGQRAVELHIQRALGADVLQLAQTVDTYLADIRPTLPAELNIGEYLRMADVVDDRINLLLRNGLSGLVLVVTILFIFLNGRVAFWVMAGVPVALLATMVIMLATGQSINMVSLFGLILVLGILVDDTIVVAEHAETKFHDGIPPADAVIEGAHRMAVPVLCASITTVASFSPLLMISDILGEIISAIPLTVITAILASLVECFLILPGHLRGAFLGRQRVPSRFRRQFDAGFDRFRHGPVRQWIEICINHRYLTLSAALSGLIVCLGLVLGGRIGFTFFPSPEAERLYANVHMFAGTPRAETEEMLDALDRALVRAAETLTEGDDVSALVRMRLHKVGGNVGRDPGRLTATGDHIGGMTVELTPSEFRSVRTNALIDQWRKEVTLMPGVDSLTIVPATSGPPGRDLDLRVAGTDLVAMRAAADEIKALLARFPGVSEVEDDMPYGKEETILRITPRGQALGFTTETAGRQVRNAFQGAIAKRFPRQDEEVIVRVQLARDAIGQGALSSLYLRGPGGAEVKLDDIVATEKTQGFDEIRREDGRREIALTAEINPRISSATDIIGALQRNGLRDIGERHGVSFRFAGKAEEQAQTFADMRLGAMIALVAIYIVLAWVFASYTQPLIVMAIIPLSFIGASLGHYLLGYDLTILSIVALLGLSGIVVNDSIILVKTIQDYRRNASCLREAIVSGTCARVRAIVLTSATTIGGLLPLIFEKSLQAQFLIPMAVTIVFGLLGTTFLVLFVVPSLMIIEDDAKRVFRRRSRSTAAPGGFDKAAAELRSGQGADVAGVRRNP